MNRLAILLVLMLTPFLLSMSKKKPYTITFHVQAEENDLPNSMFPIDLEGRRYIFKVVPELTQSNITAFYPFPSESGSGKGVAMQMDFSGKMALETLTRMRQGQYILALVDGKPVDYVVIDGVISDGMVTVWQGVSDEIIALMDKKIARLNPGNTPSSSDRLDMLPSTKKEKKRFFNLFKKGEKDKDKDKKPKEGEEATEEIPSLSLPTGPVSSSMPVEGGEGPPPSAARSAEPALPIR